MPDHFQDQNPEWTPRRLQRNAMMLVDDKGEPLQIQPQNSSAFNATYSLSTSNVRPRYPPLIIPAQFRRSLQQSFDGTEPAQLEACSEFDVAPRTSNALKPSPPLETESKMPLGELQVQFRLGHQPEEVKREDWTILKTCSSKVSIVSNTHLNLVMAWKVTDLEANKIAKKQLMQELRVVHNCNSDYLVEYYGVFEDEARNVVMCMEYMDVGSLDQVSKSFGPIQVEVWGKISVSILGGINYLYEKHHIMHRDVKPANILLNSKGEVKLYNFGMSGQSLQSVASTFAGTATYMAPERIVGSQYTIKSDVWSVGLTLMELATGRFPYASDNTKAEELGPLDLLQLIVGKPSPCLPKSDTFPQILVSFIDKCLLKDPKDRPHPRDLLFLLRANRAPIDMNKWAVNMKECIQGQQSRTTPALPDTTTTDANPFQNSFQFETKAMDPVTLTAYLPFWLSLKDLMSFTDAKDQELTKTPVLCSRCEESTKSLRTDRITRQRVDETARELACPLCQLIIDCVPPGSNTTDALKKADPAARSGPQEEIQRHAILKVGRQDQFTEDILRTGAEFEDLSTGCHPAFQMAAAWMDTCLTGHSNCNAAWKFPLSSLPTRVIDVGPSDNSRDPRLVLGDNQRALYFTLSYRWNQTGSAAFQTVQSNLDAYKIAIPLKILPQTMKDAILITRRFGVIYLWIDALCIIQDLEDDWKEEAKEMARIYKNSLLTIAAAAYTTDGAEGCFQKRSRMRTQPLKIKSKFTDGFSQYIFADRRITKDGARPLSPLDTRAWVLQEQLLSPQVLTYSDKELYWDCTTMNASETFPNGVPSFYDADWKFSDERLFKEAILSHSNTNISKSRFYLSWRKVIEVYSERKMTKETDKLAALRGLVKEAAIFLDDELIVGLWERRLEVELLWWVKNPKKSKRHEAFSAATWSWISINAPISYTLDGFDTLDAISSWIKIIQIEEGPVTSVSTLSGKIVVKGVLVPMHHLATREWVKTLKWRPDLEGPDWASVSCLMVAASEYYTYALGIIPIERDNAIYQRVGLICCRGDPLLMRSSLNRWWKDENKLKMITII